MKLSIVALYLFPLLSLAAGPNEPDQESRGGDDHDDDYPACPASCSAPLTNKANPLTLNLAVGKIKDDFPAEVFWLNYTCPTGVKISDLSRPQGAVQAIYKRYKVSDNQVNFLVHVWGSVVAYSNPKKWRVDIKTNCSQPTNDSALLFNVNTTNPGKYKLKVPRLADKDDTPFTSQNCSDPSEAFNASKIFNVTVIRGQSNTVSFDLDDSDTPSSNYDLTLQDISFQLKGENKKKRLNKTRVAKDGDDIKMPELGMPANLTFSVAKIAKGKRLIFKLDMDDFLNSTTICIGVNINDTLSGGGNVQFLQMGLVASGSASLLIPTLFVGVLSVLCLL